MSTTSTSLAKKLLILFLLFAGLYFAKGFLMPLSIAAVLATLLLPLCKLLEGKEISTGLAALICLLVLFFTAAFIVAVLGWQISALTNDIELLKLRVLALTNRIQDYFINHLGISAENQLQIFKTQQSSVTSNIPKLVGSLVSVFANSILILAYIFFLLYYRLHIKTFFLKLSKSSQQNEMKLVVYNATQVSQRYLLGLAKVIIYLWVMYGIGFSIIGVKNALLFAFLCGILEIVPFIGNITGTILTIVISAVQGASLSMLSSIALIYIVVEFIQNWIVEPFILGPQVKINPLFTIIALVLGDFVWGIPGVFLAIPLIAIFKIVCDHIEPLKPYGFLIGEIENKKAKLSFIIKIKNWYHRKRSK